MKVTRTTSGKYIVEAVAKALDILEVFSNSEGLTLNEVSRRVGLNKSRTFRLLYTLAQRGYVVRSADGLRYRLGVKLLERAANVHRNIKDVARPVMLELQERFNETVNLSVLDDGGNVLYLDIAESSRPFRMTATVGCRMPAHITSMGKAMLAYMGIEEARPNGSSGMADLAPKAWRALCRELDAIRRQGYALDREENEPGVGCIGAPIFDAEGRPVAAMSVSGPVHRVLAKEKAVADAVLAACRAVSKKLGFEPTAAYRSASAVRPLARSAEAAK